jgi:hypothetical protein
MGGLQAKAPGFEHAKEGFNAPTLGIGQGSVVNSLAFLPTLMLRTECGAAAVKAQIQRRWLYPLSANTG